MHVLHPLPLQYSSTQKLVRGPCLKCTAPLWQSIVVSLTPCGVPPTLFFHPDRWDTSLLRPKGARLKTFGGRASGPEPLESLFLFAVQMLTHARGRRLTPLEAHDLTCKVGAEGCPSLLYYLCLRILYSSTRYKSCWARTSPYPVHIPIPPSAWTAG